MDGVIVRVLGQPCCVIRKGRYYVAALSFSRRLLVEYCLHWKRYVSDIYFFERVHCDSFENPRDLSEAVL